MSNYDSLKNSIKSIVRQNGNQEITGDNLQAILLSLVNSVGEYATFAGIATPTTSPGMPDQHVFYVAAEPGTYSNFGKVKLTDGQLAFFSNKDKSWTGKILNLRTTYDLDRILSLSTSSNSDTVKLAFTPIGSIGIRIPHVGDIIASQSESIGNNKPTGIVTEVIYKSLSTIIKFTAEGITYEYEITPYVGGIYKITSIKKSNIGNIGDAASSNGSIYSQLEYIKSGGTVNSKEFEFEWIAISDHNGNDKKLYIATNQKIPDGWKLFMVWRSRNRSRGYSFTTKELLYTTKKSRWTRPEALWGGKTSPWRKENNPINYTYNRIDTNNNLYMYATNFQAYQVVSPFVLLYESTYGKEIRFKDRTMSNPYILQETFGDAKNYKSYNLNLGLAFFKPSDRTNKYERVSKIIPIGIDITNKSAIAEFKNIDQIYGYVDLKPFISFANRP